MDRDEIVLLFPEVIQRTFRRASGEDRNVLSALLGVMERLHAPDEEILENLDCFFDPARVPQPKAGTFLPFLAHWVDLDWLLLENVEYEAGLHCLRELILAAPRLAAVRGTRLGLTEFLEVATGLRGYQVEDHSTHPFCIVVRCPPGAARLRPLVERIVAGEKPAYIKSEIIFSEQAAPAGSPVA